MSARRLVVVAAACAAAFIGLGAWVGAAAGPVRVDEVVFDAVLDRRVALFESLARAMGVVGTFAVMMPMSVAAAWLLFRRGVACRAAVAVPVALWFTALSTSALKGLYDRARPPESLHLGESSSAAFPSGHASYAAALVVTVVLALGLVDAPVRWSEQGHRAVRMLPWVGALLVATMGVSRVVLRVHWLTDVVAGWLLGLAVGVSSHVVALTVGAAAHGATPRVHETGSSRT
jgi:undecaprenyl-diphosphatase